MYSVYALVDPRDEQIKYIGISNDAQVRFQAHLRCIGTADANKEKIAWIRELMQDNLLPTLTIIEEVDTDKEASQRESHWIQHYLLLGVPLTNIKGASMGLATYPARKQRQHLPKDQYWTPKEIATSLKVKGQTVRNYIKKGQLKAIRFGDNWRISDEALREFIEQQNKN